MLTGNYLQNFDSFRYAINSEPVQDNVIKLNSDNNVFYFQDGSVWMFQEYHLTEPSLKRLCTNCRTRCFRNILQQ